VTQHQAALLARHHAEERTRLIRHETTTIAYDKLGRVTQRTEPDMTAVWTYDTALHGIGKLASTSITAGPEAGYQKAVSYDSLSRPVQVATTIDSIYTVGATYDAQGRQSTATYPSGFSVTYAYNSLGYIQQLKNTVTGQAYWTANVRDAELHLTQQTAGNGVVTNRSFNAQTGRLASITAGLGSGSAVENMSYSYDTLGNLLSRADANTGLSESFTSSGTRWNEYLVVGKTMIGVRFLFADETTSTRYFHHDHLGSIAVITNEAGAVLDRNSHDSWGKRRFPNGTDDPTGSVTSLTTQGHTGQEELTGFGLVHLNGRVYDPFVGRMMSADPTVPEPMNAQAWNRYSYVINNPLAFTDPSGYSWLSEAFHAVQNFFRAFPIIGAIIKIAATAICYAVPGCSVFWAAVIASAAVAGITTGKLSEAFKAGVIAGATALAFNAIGDITGQMAGLPAGVHGPLDPFSEAHVFNVFAHAALGCASSVVSGGKCEQGALSGGITSFAGPWMNGDGRTFSVGSLVANTVLGGVASVAAGGKFANGAITGSFGYLFNACAAGQGGCIPKSSGLLAGLPTELQMSISRVGIMINSLGDPDLIALFDAWQIRYRDIMAAGDYGVTDPGIKTTTFNQFTLRLSTPEEYDFVVAHEFGHMTPENVAPLHCTRGRTMQMSGLAG
jgi:RHS repeat-associated protein